MAIRNIVQVGDEVLTKKCRPVTEYNDRLHQLLDDMAETLRDAGGLGLAAPQVGVLRACAVVEQADGSYIEIVNPVIVKSSGAVEDAEGCLSLPGRYGMVLRPEKVTVKAEDRYGNPITIEAEGYTARAFCHEIDHLSGHLFTELVTEYIDPEDLK